MPRRPLVLAVAGVTVAALAPAIAAAAHPAAAATAPVNACGNVPPQLSTFQNPLPIPAAVSLTAPTSLPRTQTLYEVPAQHAFDPAGQPGKTTATWAYSLTGAGDPARNSYLGPVLVARRGVPVDLTVVNQLGGVRAPQGTPDTALPQTGAGTTAVHLHGGHTDISSDGEPDDVFGDGQSRTYHYVNDAEAAALWFHDHALGNTRLNVLSGLAGGYVVRDAYDTGAAGNPEGLPYGYGTAEFPLILQDRSFNPDMSVCYPVGEPGALARTWIPEYFGDTAVVNGAVRPYLGVAPGIYRFRLYNAAQSRYLRLSLKLAAGTGSAILYQVGDSGGLLNAPVRLQSLLMGPGQRADVLVDFRTAAVGAAFTLSNDAPAPYPSGPRAGRRGGVPVRQLLQFRVDTATRPAGSTVAVPTTLRGPNQPAPVARASCTTAGRCVRVRNIYLNEILSQADEPQRASINNLAPESADGSQNGSIVSVPLDAAGNPTGAPATWLSDTPYADPVEDPQVDTVEQWNLINTTMDTHPIHLHLAQFRLIGRQSVDAAAYLGLLNGILAQKGFGPLPTYSDAQTAAAGHGPWPAPSADRFTYGGLRPPSAEETGWMDTVNVPPGQITRILVPFGGDGQQALSPEVAAWGVQTSGSRYTPVGTLPAGEAPYTGSFVNGDQRPYVYHCHILEHEENAMMLSFRVTAD